MHTRLATVLLLLSAALSVAADSCTFSAGELEYDLSQLGGPKVLTRTRETPPSTHVDELRFDVCGDLTEVQDRAPEDQCPSGARACLTVINQKTDSPDRITSVVPIALSSDLKVDISASSSPDSLSITLRGASYPPSSAAVSQSLKISLSCAENTADPRFISYENGEALVEWSSAVACRAAEPPKKGESNGGGGREEDTPVESVGSGLGFFFLILILAFAAYFILGAYHNYATYGARGWDLIPHRDFWREVPYMLQDVIAHLCSNVRMQRSSRGGYIAV